MATSTLHVEVVSAERSIWSGEAVNIIARTVEGDIGILPGHEPMLAALVPCAAEIVAEDGRRELVAIDGGFLSVAKNEVSIVAARASLSGEFSVADAQAELDQLQRVIDSGEATTEQVHEAHLAQAQLKAAAKLGHGNQI